MNAFQTPTNTHKGYHAHIYFDDLSEPLAADIYQKIDAQFNFELGRFHKKAIGPHTKWMFQVPFTHRDFDHFITWLEQNRDGLSILIHPLTGDNLEDHSLYASWLGSPIKLNLEIFEK